MENEKNEVNQDYSTEANSAAQNSSMQRMSHYDNYFLQV